MNFKQFKKDIGEEVLVVFSSFLLVLFFFFLVTLGIYFFAFS